MPRSATDATRFTSTTPHATSISQSTASRIQQAQQQKGKGSVGPPGETPLEKVRRLRAAADRARDAQVSTVDRMIVRGRVWADIAHRTTTLFLIGCTFVAGGVTVYALGDMIVYNRKKRAQFFAEQKAIHQNAIHSAQQSIASGTATEAELEFLQREKDHDLYLADKAKEKAAKKGMFKRGKEWLFSGLSNEDDGAREEEKVKEFVREEVHTGQEKASEVLRSMEAKKERVQDKAKQAFADEKERQRTGGPLDRLATPSPAGESEQPRSGGWTSWMIRK